MAGPKVMNMKEGNSRKSISGFYIFDIALGLRHSILTEEKKRRKWVPVVPNDQRPRKAE